MKTRKQQFLYVYKNSHRAALHSSASIKAQGKSKNWEKSGPVVFPTAAAAAKSLQLCLTLCDPTDGSPPGSPVRGILQARTLEWVTIPSPMHESEK